MGKKKHVRADPSAAAEGGGFDMTPMIDVTFLLIIFFMCVTELSDASKAKMILPMAEAADPDEHIPGRLVINVVKKNDNEGWIDGDVVILGDVIDRDTLNKILHNQALETRRGEGDFPDRAILIRADREVEYGYVQQVLNLLIQNRLWRVAFATRDPSAPPPRR